MDINLSFYVCFVFTFIAGGNGADTLAEEIEALSQLLHSKELRSWPKSSEIYQTRSIKIKPKEGQKEKKYRIPLQKESVQEIIISPKPRIPSLVSLLIIRNGELLQFTTRQRKRIDRFIRKILMEQEDRRRTMPVSLLRSRARV